MHGLALSSSSAKTSSEHADSCMLHSSECLMLLSESLSMYSPLAYLCALHKTHWPIWKLVDEKDYGCQCEQVGDDFSYINISIAFEVYWMLFIFCFIFLIAIHKKSRSDLASKVNHKGDLSDPDSEPNLCIQLNLNQWTCNECHS